MDSLYTWISNKFKANQQVGNISARKKAFKDMPAVARYLK